MDGYGNLLILFGIMVGVLILIAIGVRLWGEDAT